MSNGTNHHYDICIQGPLILALALSCQLSRQAGGGCVQLLQAVPLCQLSQVWQLRQLCNLSVSRTADRGWLVAKCQAGGGAWRQLEPVCSCQAPAAAVTASWEILKAVAEPKSASRFFPLEAAFLRILAILGGGPRTGAGRGVATVGESTRHSIDG